MSEVIPVLLTGAAGKMGLAAVKALSESPDTELYAATTRLRGLGLDAGSLAGLEPLGLTVSDQFETLLAAAPPETVLVDLTHGAHAFAHAQAAIQRQIPVVIGATGLDGDQIEQLRQQAQAAKVGVILAPNFSIGAVLMMKFAQEAARYFEYAEIIELHHAQKRDAPSGTAIKTAELIARAHPHYEVHPARGQAVAGVPIHSVRMPGLLAHQEVIFGAAGQTLTLRHDSVDRASFMPGLLLCVKRAPRLDHLIYGLEHLL
jgi:4-hydroxy-tetrahydrodipicolinate reductase